MIFDKDAKTIQWGKDSLFKKWCQENWISMCERMKLDPYLTPYTKINSKLIKDRNIRAKTLKLLEENMGGNLDGIGLTPKAQATKEK